MRIILLQLGASHPGSKKLLRRKWVSCLRVLRLQVCAPRLEGPWAPGEEKLWAALPSPAGGIRRAALARPGPPSTVDYGAEPCAVQIRRPTPTFPLG